MLGTLVNSGAIIVGALIGLLIGRALPQRLGDTVMKGLALCTIYIGISGALKGGNMLVLIISIILGAIIGESLDLDDKLNRLGKLIEGKFKAHEKNSIAQGFVTSSLLFCVGAMAIVGSLQSGLTGDHTTIYLKSTLDFTASIIFASQLGVGVIFSSVFVLAYQGSIVLLANWIAPLLSEPVIAEMTCAGSVIIIGLAVNMLGISNIKLKVMNYVPAIFIAAAIQAIYINFFTSG